MKQRGFRYCSECKNKLQKRGKTAAGKQRWLCRFCQQSLTKPRLDLSKDFVLEKFVVWLLDKHNQDEQKQAGRTFRSQTSWCWGITPPSPLTGEIHHAIIVDGIRTGGMVCLIARTTSYVIAWKWVPYESSQYWLELFRMLPQPKYIVCDGQKGLLKALSICWTEIIIQRCRFHTWLNIRTKLTLHPESLAGQDLLNLAQGLLHVRTKRQARRWKRQLKFWYRKHQDFVNERTIKINPKPRQRKWRYTHERLRSAYHQLHKCADDLLRSSYRSNPELPSTTNHIEGGINSQIRTNLKAHRGMPAAHQMRLVDWYLYSRTEEPKPPRFCL